MNTAADLQRHRFREADGQVKFNGGKDPFYINAKYRGEDGETRVGLLLGSGYWGVVRHPNYVFELLSFLAWTLALGKVSIYGYLPALLLAAILYGRAIRDENRCLAKYGGYWIQHCNRVPYQFIPGIM